MSLWAIAAAPLIAGNDLRDMTPDVLSILTNAEVIAVDQDAAGYQGVLVSQPSAQTQVWMKPLSQTGTRAVVILNRGNNAETVSVAWNTLGLSRGDAQVRDLWRRADLGSQRFISATVQPHDVVMFKVQGQDLTVSTGSIQLSNAPWIYAANGWGPTERNQSNGESAANDGRPLQVNGQGFDTGLGVHAESKIVYNLGGSCQTFSGAVGLDDDVADSGIVRFEIVADGEVLFESGLVYGFHDAQPFEVNVTGKSQLALILRGNGHAVSYSHGDWLNPTLTCN
jgi:alpha-galactosidase